MKNDQKVMGILLLALAAGGAEVNPPAAAGIGLLGLYLILKD